MSQLPVGLTVITEPTPFYNVGGCPINIDRTFLLRLRKWLLRFSSQSPGGHVAVTRSLIHGLRTLGCAFNYNPALQASIKSHCVVLSNAEALSQAIQLKRSGRIDYIFAGPNIVTLPNEAEGVVAATEVDACIVPSNWVRDLYVACCPGLKGRIIVWAAGVDAECWRPISKQQSGTRSVNILIYVKGSGNGMLPAVIKLLERARISARTIEYGVYSTNDYRNSLNWADLMIVLGGTESQGIAMAEAWSMNVPTLVKREMTWYALDGRGFPASASPYLSVQTGAFFSGEEELFLLINMWMSGETIFSPRSWILKNMTDEICAKNLLRSIDDRKK